MSKYPTALDDADSDAASVEAGSTDTLPGPGYVRRAIIAVETKLGIGDTAPTDGDILVGDGAGSSAWEELAAQATIAALIAREELQKATVSLDTADILALHTTPITLVADPGDGFVVVPTRVLFDYDHLTADFELVSGTPAIEVTDGTNVMASYTIAGISADALDSDAAASGPVLPSQAIVAEINSGSVDTGLGSLDITVWYTVEAV